MRSKVSILKRILENLEKEKGAELDEYDILEFCEEIGISEERMGELLSYTSRIASLDAPM